MKNSDIILHKFLVESNAYTEEEFENLHEETKIDAIKTIAVELFKEIYEASKSMDMTIIDRSRGDIKNLRDLDAIQKTIAHIENLIDTGNALYNDSIIREYITAITKSIFYLNQYSSQFRDGYRMKKSMIIMRYQTIIIAIIAATAYLFSSVVDFSSGEVKLKSNIRIDDTSALRTLKQFIDSVNSGEFKLLVKDTNYIREFYVEIPDKEMSTIQEASDVFSTVLTGVKNLYTNLDSGGKLTGLIYKAVGIIAVLYSMRDIIFTVIKSRFKVSELFDMVRNFANFKNLPSLNKLYQFAPKFRAESEANSELASRDIVDSNKEIVNKIKALPAPEAKYSFDQDSEYMLDLKKPATSGSNTAFDDLF